ncbi:hypothetical protein Dsin_023644 [Dipteronia sinensis]|uniref:Uncharacterized protein n=1 Tax=Dipteronia sinensis TaxID=43782 RepID=A0AAE0E193_9ROSI|nr:hypothetical protein Dsin_023644 [Dipteronia sinensis]
MNFGKDLDTFLNLGVSFRLRKATKIQIVVWRAPPLHWIKVNYDGLSKGNVGPAAYGAVFRSSEGDFIRFSHIYRGNCIADRLANIGLGLNSFTWWDSTPAQIRCFLVRDACGLPNYSFSS